jgi:transmembrane sensor
MTEEQLQELLLRFTQGLCTPEEEQLLMQWAKKQEELGAVSWTEKERNTFKNIQATAITNATGINLHPENTKADSFHSANANATNIDFNSTKRISYTPWIAAASILLLIIAGYFLYNNQSSANQKIIAANQQIISPGTNKALLILSDGTSIALDSAENGTIAHQGKLNIVKLANGQLIYQLGAFSPFEKGGAGSAHDGTLRGGFNTMSTPRGGQYQLTLPDGTTVWLNAASSITYPVLFTENTRTVTISGEAFLDIKKDKSKPFIVNTKNEKIQVLGTTFNINNYDDENISKTTLVDGAIKVNTSVLQPGQQMQTNIITGKTNITKVDTDLAIAWKNGQFNFSGSSVETVMRQLSRWYNVEVEYKGKIPERRFGGKISRDVNLNEIISILNFNDIKAKLNGRKIIIEP